MSHFEILMLINGSCSAFGMISDGEGADDSQQ
jgi:hypothetical protein